MTKLVQQARAVLRLPLDRLEERRLSRQLPSWHRPRHVGMILDGNRRYARESGAISVLEGHARGADKLYEVLSWLFESDVHVVTAWIFSLDNFNRTPAEVKGLFDLIERRTYELIEHPDVHRHEVNVRFIGRTQLLPERLRRAIAAAEQATEHYSRNYLNIAIAYGGREEITDAAKRFLLDHSHNGTTLAQLAEKLETSTLGEYLYTSHHPDPDLIIRTSGEVRLSGFLLWQSAYAEYYFCDSYWPQFRKVDLLRALHAFHCRQRRFGR